ncbi:MAG: hypothetical protein Q8O67_21055 [Deltaproteobacteria bacterium]|nr:hypothetical protein [Deltaproteobacteria bacterium]
MFAGVPPALPFPGVILPADGGVLARNGAVVAYGDQPVRLDEVTVLATLDGAPLPTTSTLIGCCAARIALEGLVEGGSVELEIAAGPADPVFVGYRVGPDDDDVPTIGAAAFVQVVSDGPAFIVTIDVDNVSDDVVSLSTLDAAGTLLGVEPPAGTIVERLRTGVSGTGDVCLTIEAADAAGHTARTQACGSLEPQNVDDNDLRLTQPGTLGCGAAGAPFWFVLAGLALAFRRRAAVLALLCSVGCAVEPPGPHDLCGAGFDDHTAAGADFDDAFFDAHAREELGTIAVKFIAVHPRDPTSRRVGFLDGDFYPLHDHWFTFRLMNGAPACGADEILPVQGESFDDVDAVIAWALTQERLPPFLAWQEERLYAPDFYRLARDADPRVYLPGYLTRDVADDVDGYALRVAPRDDLLQVDVEAAFATLEPLMPAGRTLYWKPSSSPIQQATATAMIESGHALAPRIVMP